MNFQNEFSFIQNNINVNVRANIIQHSKKIFSINYLLSSMSLNSTDKLKLKSFKENRIKIKIKITEFNLLLNRNLIMININYY